MGLILEHRIDGQLVSSSPAVNGRFFVGSPLEENEEDWITVGEARKRCRGSSHMPPERREWSFRISFSE